MLSIGSEPELPLEPFIYKKTEFSVVSNIKLTQFKSNFTIRLFDSLSLEPNSEHRLKNH